MAPGRRPQPAEACVTRMLSRTCRAYVVGVGLVGVIPLGWAVWSVVQHPPHLAWYGLAALALVSGRLCVRMPSMQATISVSDGFILTSALLFGTAPAVVISAIDGLAVSLWTKNRAPVRSLFGVGEPALSVCLASLLFYELAAVPPLLHHATPLVSLVVPLFALSTTYFALNTILAGMAVWLDRGGAPLELLRQHLQHVALDFCVSMSLGAALVQTSGNLTLSVIVVLVPMLLASYISSHHVAGRLEDTSRHLAELRRLYDSTIETLAMAVDAKDQVTHGHIRRVQLLSARVAAALGASAQDTQALQAAALLHDLGKLAVPEHILNKPGPLTPAEYDQMKKHAEVGASILSAIEFPFPVVPMVRHHHENWDGSGYPDGLRGTDIPLGARILAVVDCYDALTSDRPYRRRMTHDDALQIIRRRSGQMYDPEIVDVFARVVSDADDEHESSEDPVRAGLRRVIAGALQIAPGPTSNTAPAGVHRDSSVRVAAFLASIGTGSWEKVAKQLAPFLTAAMPDCVPVLFRFDAKTHRLITAGMPHGLDARVPHSIDIGHGVTGWVAANRQVMANTDAELDLGGLGGAARPPLRLCVSAPVQSGDTLAGVLTIYSPYAFSEPDRMLIEAVAANLSTVLRADEAAESPHTTSGTTGSHSGESCAYAPLPAAAKAAS
jgi:putative nucleotidyltransferase with HDIG domain